MIYLAGPINRVADDGASWRDLLIEDCPDVDWHNPLDDVQMPAADAVVVESDLEAVRRADGILVGYEDVLSVGTAMEVKSAADIGLPIAMWVRDETAHSNLSPWYRHFCDYTSYAARDAVDYLTEEIQR